VQVFFIYAHNQTISLESNKKHWFLGLPKNSYLVGIQLYKMGFGYIKYLTISRIINLIKLWISYYFSILRSKPIHWGMPYSVSIEPTNTCNLACPECPTGNGNLTRAKSNINVETNKKIIDEISKYLFCAIYYFQGEPFLNPQLFEMIEYASKSKIFTISSTNGHFLNQNNSEKIIKSGLQKLIISLDGITPETYQIYRKNGHFNRVMEGIKTIIATKKQLNSKTPQIVIQFLVFKSNQYQIPDLKSFAKKIGVDRIVLKTAQFYDFKNGNNQMPDIKKYSRYKKNIDGSYSIKSKLKNHCWRMWSNPVITTSGKLSACCFDKNSQFNLGNIESNSFGVVWNSVNYKNLRQLIFTNRKAIDICTNCTEGLARSLY
jgi:radical SAM protein with 4Fe4S-binding SPASM domain